MKNWIKENKKIFKKIIITASLIIALIILSILQTNPYICEWWSQTISRYYQTGIGFLVKYIPFSVVEICIISLIVFGLIYLVKLFIDLFKKRFKFALNKGLLLSILVLGMTTLYVASTSLAYYRLPIPISLYEDNVDKSNFNKIVKYFLDDFNYCSSQLTYKETGEVEFPYSVDELCNNLTKEYEKLDNPYYSSFTTKPKPMLTSFLYVQFQITGVYVGLTGEVNYDAFMTNGEYPFTLAHELAHSKGVMRENDAQLLAAYICLNSDDAFIRYSGYLYTFNSLLILTNYTGNENDYINMYHQMDTDIIKHFDYIGEYWDKHNLLEVIGEFFNDLYLKIFGSGSTDDYDDPPPEVDPGTNEITSFSRYQRLFFQKYVDDGNII